VPDDLAIDNRWSSRARHNGWRASVLGLPLGERRNATGWINRRSPDIAPVFCAVVPLNAPRGAPLASLQDKSGEVMNCPALPLPIAPRCPWAMLIG